MVRRQQQVTGLCGWRGLTWAADAGSACRVGVLAPGRQGTRRGQAALEISVSVAVGAPIASTRWRGASAEPG